MSWKDARSVASGGGSVLHVCMRFGVVGFAGRRTGDEHDTDRQATPIRSVVKFYLCPVAISNRPDDGKAEAAATGIVAPRRTAEESVEDSGPLFSRDARPVVDHSKHGLGHLRHNLDVDRTSWGIAQRVVDEVVQQHRELHQIAVDAGITAHPYAQIDAS